MLGASRSLRVLLGAFASLDLDEQEGLILRLSTVLNFTVMCSFPGFKINKVEIIIIFFSKSGCDD